MTNGFFNQGLPGADELRSYINIPLLIGDIVLCFALGLVLKSIPRISNWLIPILLLPIGLSFYISVAGWDAFSVLWGVSSAAFSVYGYQGFVKPLLRQAMPLMALLSGRTGETERYYAKSNKRKK